MAGAVEHVGTAVYTVPTPAPETDGTAEWSSTSVVAVRVGAGGEEGLGWTYAEPVAARVVDDVLAPLIVGADPDDVPALRHRMLARTRNAGTSGLVAAAMSAVDTALWDLKARRLGVGLPALLGRARDAVPVYGSGGFTSYDDATTVAELEHWLSLGMRDVKIKIGQGWGGDPDRDLARVALTRRTVGERVGVLVDANGGYSVGQAVRMERWLREDGVIWFEEPVSADFPAQLAEVRRTAVIDVAAGEYVWRTHDAEALLAAGAVDCLQLDVTRCGGYSGWFEAAAMAGGRGLQVSAHCAPHLAATAAVSTPNVRHLEYFVDHERVDDALFDGLPPLVDGALRPDPDAVGHGMRLAPRAEQHRAA